MSESLVEETIEKATIWSWRGSRGSWTPVTCSCQNLGLFVVGATLAKHKTVGLEQLSVPPCPDAVHSAWFRTSSWSTRLRVKRGTFVPCLSSYSKGWCSPAVGSSTPSSRTDCTPRRLAAGWVVGDGILEMSIWLPHYPVEYTQFPSWSVICQQFMLAHFFWFRRRRENKIANKEEKIRIFQTRSNKYNTT